MDETKSKITELEFDNQQLRDTIELLERDIDGLLHDKKALKMFIKEDTLLVGDFIRQGFKYQYKKNDLSRKTDWGQHYVVFPIGGIPGSLNIKDVKQLIDEALDPYLSEEGAYHEYVIEHFNYSNRKQVWYVQVAKVIDTYLDSTT